MWGFNYFPVITLPAKINENNHLTKYSLIDQIWSNFTSGREHISGVIDYLITDHLPIFYSFHTKFKCKIRFTKFRLITNERIQNFIDNINRVNFNLFEIGDPDQAFDTFYDTLFNEYNLCFPDKRKRVKANLINEPWVTRDLKRCIKKKFQMYNLLKRGLITRSRFNMYKNTLAWLMGKMKNNYYINKFKHSKNDQKVTWKNINAMLNRNKKQMVNEITSDDGEKLNGKDMVTCFNNYFCNIASNLVRSLPQGVNQNILNPIDVNPMSCVLHPTNEVEVFCILKNMKDKGSNLYCIRPSLLLKVSNIIIPLLVYLYNLCLIKGIYPNKLKTARVVPIFKNGKTAILSNYRPISNLSAINKVFEKLTYERIMSFVSKYKIIKDTQFGFRKNCSTTLAVFTLLNDLFETIRKKTFTIAIFLDLSKAFDVIDRDILLRKLELYGFRGVVGKFLASYLSNRYQYVTCDSHESDIKEITYGVPQGSILGPLFLSYI